MIATAPQLQIRPMTPADLDSVIELAAQLHEAPHWSRPAWEAALNPANSPRRLVLIAERAPHAAPIGFIVASQLAPEAELESIAVVPEAQRTGIGAGLLNVLIENLRAAAVTHLQLEVRASNQTARSFYQSQGFVETGRRTQYYREPPEDAALMTLTLISASVAIGNPKD